MVTICLVQTPNQELQYQVHFVALPRIVVADRWVVYFCKPVLRVSITNRYGSA